jgi:hypothetical protein
MEIRLLSDHRQDLVPERTSIQNRLRWHLLELCDDLEPTLRPGALDTSPRRPAPTPAARRHPATCRARGDRPATRPQPPDRRAATRPAELLKLVTAYRPQLLDESGCGALTAAILTGRTAGAPALRDRCELCPPDRDRAENSTLSPEQTDRRCFAAPIPGPDQHHIPAHQQLRSPHHPASAKAGEYTQLP